MSICSVLGRREAVQLVQSHTANRSWSRDWNAEPEELALTLFKEKGQGLPGGSVVKALPSNAAGRGSIPGQGAMTPHASGPKKNPKTRKQATL